MRWLNSWGWRGIKNNTKNRLTYTQVVLIWVYQMGGNMKTVIFEKTQAGHTFKSEAYVGPRGEIRWKSNNRCVPADVFRDYGMEEPAVQAEIRDAELNTFLKAYVEANQNREYTAEEKFEMRSAFGEGAEVVNVVTGKKVKL